MKPTSEGAITLPTGSDHLTGFRVRIIYREPTYEAATGKTCGAYSGTFLVSAPSHVAAANRAMNQFRELERLSSVGWVREVVEVQVEVDNDAKPHAEA